MLEVHQRLLSLYCALIVAEQLTYERIHGRIGSTDELIQLLLRDPWFTWLSPLLDLLLRIDQLLTDDAFDITHENVAHLVAEVRNLTHPSIEGDGFELLMCCTPTFTSRAPCRQKPRKSSGAGIGRRL